MDCTDVEVAALLLSTNFPTLKNDRILLAARGEVPDQVPIWIMRQAGRYLPEFQDLRKQYSFFEICQTPKLACEATLLPIRRYDLDAAIIFSDILVVPQALGLTVVMEKEKGPVFPNPLTFETIKDLKWKGALDRLTYVGQAIRLTRHKLEGKVPIFGFTAAPWTLMVYMFEGGGTKTASKAKKLLYQHGDECKVFLGDLTQLLIEYLVMQVEHGAQLLQVFESSAEYLTLAMYEEFMIPLLKHLVVSVRRELKARDLPSVPLVYFAKGGSHFLKSIPDLGFDVVGLDWSVNPKEARQILPGTTLQGNLDPCALYTSKENLVRDVNKMMKEFGKERYIVNLGHGIYPDAPTEAVEWFIDAVHSYKF